MTASASFQSCFNNRYVLDTVFGQQLFGESVDVKWIGDSEALSYYTIVNLVLMVILLLIGFCKEESVFMNSKRLSILLWQVSIVLVAISVTITGLTRWTFVWAVLHSASEWTMLFCMIRVKPSIRREFNVCFIFVGCIYMLIDLTLAMTAPMDIAYYVVAFMGAPVDFSTWFGWIGQFVQKKIRFAPMVAFSFHIVYIILVFINCAFPPWGRIAGLALNTAAIFFGSLPAHNDSWRFSEFIHALQEQEDPGEAISSGRSRSSTVNSKSNLQRDSRKSETDTEYEYPMS
jgi:hypothetical protein